MAGITELKYSEHQVEDTEIVRFLRKELQDSSLVTFRNRETGNWVLAHWVDQSRNLVNEIDDIGHDPFQ